MDFKEMICKINIGNAVLQNIRQMHPNRFLLTILGVRTMPGRKQSSGTLHTNNSVFWHKSLPVHVYFKTRLIAPECISPEKECVSRTIGKHCTQSTTFDLGEFSGDMLEVAKVS